MSALGVLEPTMELALKNNSFAKLLNNVGNVTAGTVKFQDKLVGLILKLIYQLSPQLLLHQAICFSGSLSHTNL